MAAIDLLQFLSQALYFLIFLDVAAQAYRRPSRAAVDITLLFAVTSVIIAETWVNQALRLTPSAVLNELSGALFMALPYLLLRLVDDFAGVPGWLLHVAELGLILAVVGLFVLGPTLPLGPTLLYILYFVVLEVYAAAAFVRAAHRAGGVTRRRMQAVAAGSVFLGLVLVTAGAAATLPALATVWTLLTQLFALASGLAYFLGFAPPALLRRAWQEPELRAFLGRAAHLPRLPETSMIVRALERGAAASLGARAAIGLWEEGSAALRFRSDDGDALVPAGQMISGRAHQSGEALLSTNPARDAPDFAEQYRQSGVGAIMAAPIRAGERRLGVLVLYTMRAPLFAEEDLALAQLLADQAAVVLEARALIDEAAQLRAVEQAAQMKQDFLSSAAHELKTPLTTLVAQAQLLARKAERSPGEPVDAVGLERMVHESRRLARLVMELLDASSAEEAGFLGRRERLDLAALVTRVAVRRAWPNHRVRINAPAPVVGEFDAQRLEQLLEHLLENAEKFSPRGGTVEVRVWGTADQALLEVTDQGIGIPESDLRRLFERYHRGRNVDDRRFAGLGLGLYICRQIAEQHGGSIQAHSVPGSGTRIQVTLPTLSEVELGADRLAVTGERAP